MSVRCLGGPTGATRPTVDANVGREVELDGRLLARERNLPVECRRRNFFWVSCRLDLYTSLPYCLNAA